MSESWSPLPSVPTGRLTLLIDNYDSYTFNLFQQIAEVNGRPPLVVRNDELDWAAVAGLPVDNIVISPGPGHPGRAADFGVCADVVRHAAIPVLGVCLGHQGILHGYGGSVVQAPRPMHGEVSRIRHRSALFAGIPQEFEVVRYHSLTAVEPLPPLLRATAWAEDGTVMALEAADRPLYGVQFHPESVLTQYGYRLLANFQLLHPARSSDRPPVALASGPTVPGPAVASAAPAPVSGSGFLPAPWGERPRPLMRVADAPYALPGAAVAEALREPGRPLVWLDSSAPGPDTGRFSYLAPGGGPAGETVRYRAGGSSDAGGLTLERSDGTHRIDGLDVFDYLKLPRLLTFLLIVVWVARVGDVAS
ncbi:aminodeoxychorismate/anthranilate synthase component II, partial [Streptomyces sp. LS1784]|uniref:anthranilate synthase component II n=1 Tax=Streptomyces sp. LS1784 TaxID=2851533 RepID=UPI001CCB8F10